MILILIIIVVIVIALLSWYIKTKNRLNQMPIDIEQALANIDVALTKRSETLQKQLDVTKGYAKHELDAFTSVVKLRKGMSIEELQQANEQMDEVQARINAVAESYPELNSNKNFLVLQRTINTCEAELSATRRVYNANVADYNKEIVTFPSSIVANKMNCQKRASFEATEKQRQDVQMTF